jgi:hypothetical protein
MNSKPPPSLRKICLCNAALWLTAGFLAFVAPYLQSSPEKGRLMYIFSFLLLAGGSLYMTAAAYRAGSGGK